MRPNKILSTLVLLTSLSGFVSASEFDLQPSCVSTRSIFETITKVDKNGVPRRLDGRIFDDLQQVSPSICQLSRTCCSTQAEASLHDYTADQYRDKVLTKLTEPLMNCHNHSFFDEFKRYIEASRASLVRLMQITYGLHFTPYQDIFNRFYSYLQNTIETGSACRMAEEWFNVFFEVFLAGYFGHPSTRLASQLPSTDTFKQCFYQHIFLEPQSEALTSNLNSFLQTYNQTMRYLRALKTLDKVILETVDYMFNPRCKASIMKMTHCSSCAGYGLISTCSNLCLNVLRGCLVDLSDLFGPFGDFSEALIDMHSIISNQRFSGPYYLWGLMGRLDRLFFEMISDTYNQAVDIELKLLRTCNVSEPVSNVNPVKRQIGSARASRAIAPINSLNHSAFCLADALPVLRRLPEDICQSVNTLCWNGHSLGRYGRAVLDFTRESQNDNPEVIITPYRQFEQQIANLKMATRELKVLTDTYQCEEDDEDEGCTGVPETCEYYDVVDAPLSQIKGSGSSSGSGESGSTEAATPPEPIFEITTPRIPTTEVQVGTSPEPNTVPEVTTSPTASCISRITQCYTQFFTC